MKRILQIMVLAAVMVSAVSCRTHRESEIHYVYGQSADTISQVRFRTDSIIIRDSIVTRVNGDTLYLERWHDVYRDRLRVDTVERVKTRTEFEVQHFTEVKEVNVLRWWQKILMWCGALALIALIGVMTWKYMKKR